MKTLLTQKRSCGLTLVEVLVVVGFLAILAAILLPVLARPRRVGSSAYCGNNLKQVGVSFQLWAVDHDGKFPMQVSVTNEGTQELIAKGSAYPHFLAVSNELTTPRILFCPQETSPARRQATTFYPETRPLLGLIPFTGDTNLSYFLWIDADGKSPDSVLSGDRNLTVNGVVLPPGPHLFRTNDFVSWSSEMHKSTGYVLRVDGSAATSSGSPGLLGTNRVAIP